MMGTRLAIALAAAGLLVSAAPMWAHHGHIPDGRKLFVGSAGQSSSPEKSDK
jgi:hypothetical protein